MYMRELSLYISDNSHPLPRSNQCGTTLYNVCIICGPRLVETKKIRATRLTHIQIEDVFRVLRKKTEPFWFSIMLRMSGKL